MFERLKRLFGRKKTKASSSTFYRTIRPTKRKSEPLRVGDLWYNPQRSYELRKWDGNDWVITNDPFNKGKAQ